LKRRDIVYLSVLGLVIWIVGTIYYGYMGPRVLETTSLNYWISFALSPVFSALLCIGVLRRRRIPAPHWAAAMLLLAIPGMIGEALVLTNLATFMPRLHAESGGRYGALLFATYAIVLGIAETVTLRARS
jgi:Family of unknown function (DUF5367)